MWFSSRSKLVGMGGGRGGGLSSGVQSFGGNTPWEFFLVVDNFLGGQSSGAILLGENFRSPTLSFLCNYFDNNLKSAVLAVKSISQMLKNSNFLSASMFIYRKTSSINACIVALNMLISITLFLEQSFETSLGSYFVNRKFSGGTLCSDSY